MAGAHRFELSSQIAGGAKIRNRGTDASSARAHPGDFLARLWALFGAPPSEIDEGFSYTVRDRQTGSLFRAYSGASGPSYGGDVAAAAALHPVLDAFDALLDRTDPIEVEFAFSSYDEAPRPTRRVVGFRHGQPFLRSAQAKAKGGSAGGPKSVKTTADCEAVARKLGGSHGMLAGFMKAFERLVDVPPTLRFGGRVYGNCIGLTVYEETGPVLLYDEGPGIEEIGIEEALGGALTSTLRLWLEAFWNWHAAEKLPRRALERRPALN